MRNPFKHHEQDAQAIIKPGWTTEIVRDVPASGGPLRFEARLPDDIRLVGLDDLAAAARDAPTWLVDQTEAFHDVAAAAGTVLVGAIVAQDKPNDVLATMTVVYSETLQGGPFDIKQPAAGEKVKQRVVKISDSVTMVERISAIQLSPGAELSGLIVEEYLVRYARGGIAAAFSTTHDGMGGEQGHDFFVDVLASIQLTEAPAG